LVNLDAYINRIAAVTESGQPLPEPARTKAMEQDFSAYKQISIELWQWQAAEALGKMKLISKQIAEVMIAFTIPHPTPLSKKAIFTMQQTIGATNRRGQCVS